MTILLLYIPFPDAEVAKRVAESLLQKRLIACANCMPITSSYWWGGSICEETEVAMVAKTMPDKWEMLEEVLRKLHPYTTPCFARWEVAVNADYGAWVAAETSDFFS